MDLSLALMVSAGRTDHFEKQQSQKAAMSTWHVGIVGQDGVSPEGGQRTHHSPQRTWSPGDVSPPLLGRQKPPHTHTQLPSAGGGPALGGQFQLGASGGVAEKGGQAVARWLHRLLEPRTPAAPVSGLTARGPSGQDQGVRPGAGAGLMATPLLMPPSLPPRVLTTPDKEGQEGASARGHSPGL